MLYSLDLLTTLDLQMFFLTRDGGKRCQMLETQSSRSFDPEWHSSVG